MRKSSSFSKHLRIPALALVGTAIALPVCVYVHARLWPTSVSTTEFLLEVAKDEPKLRQVVAPSSTPRIDWNSDRDQAKANLEEINQQIVRIQKEVRDLSTRDDLPEKHWARKWAGEYNHPPGSMVSSHMCIAPAAGATYTWAGCFGIEDANRGEIAGTFDEDNDGEVDGITVNWLFPFGQNPDQKTEKLYFVSWEGADAGKGRQLLIREDQMLRFVNLYNQGGFMRWDTPGFIEKINVDSRTMRSSEFGSKPATAPPRLPARWAKLLFPLPLFARIQTVTEYQRVTIDKGSLDGVYVGMEINISSDWATRDIVIDKVFDKTSEGSYRAYLNQPPPLVGETIRIAAGADPPAPAK